MPIKTIMMGLAIGHGACFKTYKIHLMLDSRQLIMAQSKSNTIHQFCLYVDFIVLGESPSLYVKAHLFLDLYISVVSDFKQSF